MIRNNKGFNLLMLSVIILALTILMSAILGLYSITNYKRRISITRIRFDDIDSAIKSYVAKYNRFPCPAPLNCNKNSCVIGSDSIGIEKVDSNGKCSIDNSGVFESTNSSSKKIYYGNIPSLTIGLANNNITDAWGNKFVYIIPEELTEYGSYYKFLYAKNHLDKNSLTINGITQSIDREYVKDGIVYLLISFNKNTEGVYSYDNKRANYFSGNENYPIQNFTINTASRKLLFYEKTYNNFKIEGLEKEMQICPDSEIINSPKTGNRDMVFYSGKYGEIVFSDEFCPSSVSVPAQPDDYFYLSTFREDGLSIDNRAAKKCGKNGEWEDGFVYECELLPRCVKPQDDSRYSLLRWTNTNFTVSNMGEVQDDDNTVRLKCIYTEDGSKWYRI